MGRTYNSNMNIHYNKPYNCRTVGNVADCDFEAGWCQYTQAQDDDFDWNRNNGRTLSTYTGPDVDHTTGTGTLSIDNFSS